jgi:hypothetical protein
MSDLIEKACMEVARTNMWDDRPVDAAPMIKLQQHMTNVGIEAQEHFEGLGATERDIADAIHFIAQVYALPQIQSDLRWFQEVLFTILEPAFPYGGVSGEAARFAEKLISGLTEQLEEWPITSQGCKAPSAQDAVTGAST